MSEVCLHYAACKEGECEGGGQNCVAVAVIETSEFGKRGFSFVEQSEAVWSPSSRETSTEFTSFAVGFAKKRNTG